MIKDDMTCTATGDDTPVMTDKYEFSSSELKLVAEEQTPELTALQSKLSKAEADKVRLYCFDDNNWAVEWCRRWGGNDYENIVKIVDNDSGYVVGIGDDLREAIDKAMQNKG